MAGLQPGAYIIVRTNSAGCFAGTLKSVVGDVTILSNARRLWYWSGAASLSGLAVTGTSKPNQCKFPAIVSEQKLFGTIEHIATTDEARKSIEEVPVWTE